MRTSREMLSVGIDVGTTTTQVVFSRLEVADVAQPGQIPRFNVTARSILYESPIQLTPLLKADEVDAPRLAKMVQAAYRAAGVTPEQIETGAVIVTGEIARARNGEEILAAISNLAGDFVVTVAGPNVEAQIAGRGSGASAASAAQFSQVTNVDIGGGTANAAIFRVGQHVASSALAVGGRQVVVERTSGLVRHIAPPGQAIINALNLPIRVGQVAGLDSLQRFTDCMADLVADLVTGVESDLGRQVQLSPPFAPAVAAGSKCLFISGGVGAYYYDPPLMDSLTNALRHDDLGVLLAQSLRENGRLQTLPIAPPAQTVRATVMGASSQTVQLSGSTIWAEAAALPLHNLPVVRPHLTEGQTNSPAALAQAIRDAHQRWDSDRQTTAYAIALDLPPSLTFPALRAIAAGVAAFAHEHLAAGSPLVLVTERDYALALGQTVKALAPAYPLVSIDQVALGEGDFIDIGKPILGGRIVPLSVKTLIFYH
jgi:ethanolamine utilization protein EutA